MEKRHRFIKWADARSGASGEEPACQCRGWKRCGFNPSVGKIPWRRKWQPTLVFLPGRFHDRRVLRTVVHGVAKSWTWPKACINTHIHTHTHMPEAPFYKSLLSRAGEGNGSPLQYSCLENPMERGTWQATFHAVARVGHNLATKSPVSRAETNHWAQWFFHCGSQTSSTSITGEFGRHANSQVHQVLRNEKL